jgi:hypothetical protein
MMRRRSMQPTVERCEGRALLSTGLGAPGLIKVGGEAARGLPDDVIEAEAHIRLTYDVIAAGAKIDVEGAP